VIPSIGNKLYVVWNQLVGRKWKDIMLDNGAELSISEQKSAFLKYKGSGPGRFGVYGKRWSAPGPVQHD
jgi:hypothetical protein